MVVGMDLIEVKDPETGEIREYRSPIYYLWLHPIKKALGWYNVPLPPAAPEKFSPQPPGQAPSTLPGLPTAPPSQPPGPAPGQPPAPPAPPQAVGSPK